MYPLFTATKEAALNNLTAKTILKKSLTPVVDHNKHLNNKLTTEYALKPMKETSASNDEASSLAS